MRTVTLSDVRDAAARIRPYAHLTPVLTCAGIDQLAGARLFFKCENFQKVGAFKFRGACNAVFSLSEEEARQGVLTHSSGNHGGAGAAGGGPRSGPGDGAGGRRTSLCPRTFSIIRRYVEEILTVDDPAIVSAMRTVWERMKIVIEPSAAVPVAALLDATVGARGLRVGVVLSGGNLDLDRLPWLA